NPMAMIVEQAGGLASDGSRRILDIQPEGLHQRTPLYIGSRRMVERGERTLRGEAGAEVRFRACRAGATAPRGRAPPPTAPRDGRRPVPAPPAPAAWHGSPPARAASAHGTPDARWHREAVRLPPPAARADGPRSVADTGSTPFPGGGDP